MNRSEIISAFGEIRLIYLVVPFLCFLAVNVIDSVRTVMVSAQFRARVPFTQALNNSFIGQLFTNLTPMAAGGQPFQIYHLQQHGLNTQTAANIILSRFVENATTLMVILVASFPVIVRISGQLGAARIVIFTGLAVTFLFAVFFLATLIRADLIGKFAMMISKGWVGRTISRVSKRKNWSQELLRWSQELKDEIHFLWTEKLWIMLIDTLLGVVDLGLQAFSIYYVLRIIVAPSLSYLEVFTSYIVIWQVVFYIPTPGASGSVEGAFAAVYSGLTRNPALTLVSIIIWRFATYYLHIFLETIVLVVYLRTQRRRSERAAQITPDAGNANQAQG